MQGSTKKLRCYFGVEPQAGVDKVLADDGSVCGLA
jgi:hypothetical protein